MQSTDQTPTVVTAQQGKQLNVLGHAITAMLTREQTGGNYYTFQCVTAPGLGIPLHLNEEGDAIATITEGEYSVMIGDRRFHALKGDVCFFPKNIPHSFQNIGTKAGTTLWTVAPGKNFEQFFNALSNIPAGDPEPAMIASIFADNGMKIIMPASV